MSIHRSIVLLLGFTLTCASADAANRPDRVEWFMDQGLGMFVHWSVDSQLGSVISHSMVGASDDYLDRFINDLPETFYPERFNPDEWARLVKLAGMKYVVFTAKHHSGFCMFHTQTTPFNIANTPYGEDITRKLFESLRKYGIAVGVYFSPDDFWMLHMQGKDVSRRRPEALPQNNPELMAHNKAQLRELLTQYGPIDILFIDGEPNELKELAWELQPDLVITRGEMETPEQNTPDAPMPGPWEACYTLGTQWQFKPTNEDYKSGTQLIEMLIEIRAKGGNFLLNVGPQPDGMIPFEQERRIRELALWMFINGEAIHGIRPWHVIREGDIWFTKAKDDAIVYAFLTKLPDWKRGDRKEFTLRSVRATEQTTVSVLGQSGRVLEYNTKVVPEARWSQEADGLHVSVVRAQRIYNDSKWPNPIVLRISHAKPAR
ncbi:MAG TPA: alpha-L-fucosidase [Sedimentisphaerales bacterium]|nr:alpha-L-fucosidase [Sedimentisphaerales bacterium]HRS12708.1 alpha-L-fucosidase [Sedimentisphaerales bacterium]HRV49310.1 alpha-L-fucosidase [Sedimentisphaerales bacterium]